MSFDKNTIKEELTIDDVFLLLEEFEAEPEMRNGHIVCKTVCHNDDVENASHKLYYYEEQKLFTCYTGCGDSFDIFDLVSKVKKIDFNTSIFYVVNFFNLQHKLEEVETESLSEDWKILKRWAELSDITYTESDKVEFPAIDGTILKYYPQPRLLDWEDQYITKEVCDYMNIHYDPVNGAIIIPHYDEYGRMIGIRERTLVEENEKYGKYKPAKVAGKMRNHALGFNLYGLDKAKDRIGELGVALVGESEKFVLQVMSYLGIKNNIAVGMCGSTLSNYQFQQLIDAGATEICIAIDRDFNSIYDDEYEKVIKKIEKMSQKYSPLCNLSFILDTKGLTGYKHSPTDDGKEIFMQLWRDRMFV